MTWIWLNWICKAYSVTRNMLGCILFQDFYVGWMRGALISDNSLFLSIMGSIEWIITYMATLDGLHVNSLVGLIWWYYAILFLPYNLALQGLWGLECTSHLTWMVNKIFDNHRLDLTLVNGVMSYWRPMSNGKCILGPTILVLPRLGIMSHQKSKPHRVVIE